VSGASQPGESLLETLVRLLDEYPVARLLVYALLALAVVHVTLAIVVWVHSRKVELQYLSRSGWTWTVLSSGVLAAMAYWIVHVVAAPDQTQDPD
jgi:hypothetical protein